MNEEHITNQKQGKTNKNEQQTKPHNVKHSKQQTKRTQTKRNKNK